MPDPVQSIADQAAASAQQGTDDQVDQGMADQFYSDQNLTPGEMPKEDEPAKKPDDAKDKKPTGDDTKDEPGDAKPDGKFWDKQRQQDQQERANERKGYESTIDRLTGLLERQIESGKADKADGKTSAKEDDHTEKLEELLKGIDNDTSTAADVAKVLREYHKMQGGRKSPELGPILDEIKTIKNELAERDARDAVNESNAQLEKMLAGLDRQFNAKYRTDAVDAVKTQLAEKGFDDEHLPHPDHVQFLLRDEYQKAWDGDPANKGKSKPKPAPSIPVDTGAGGTTIPQMPAHGDLDQVMDWMEKSGQYEE